VSKNTLLFISLVRKYADSKNVNRIFNNLNDSYFLPSGASHSATDDIKMCLISIGLRRAGMGETVRHTTFYYAENRPYSMNHREKQSVALVIAMGGLYPCPEVTEAILNPEDGQTKYILDLGVSNSFIFMGSC
jgi:hypothetical protein